VTFLSVVVPVYNETERVPTTVRAISQYLSAEYPDHEIVAVDDGSTDGSPAMLDELARSIPRLRILQYTPNEGKGVAVRRGCAAATGDWVAIVDADLELPISLLREFFRVQRESHAQVVVGSKRHPDSVVEYPKVRARLSRAYGRGIRYMFRIPVSDTQVGFKLIDRQALGAVLPYLYAKRFAFDVELLMLLNRCGAQIAEAPIQLRFSRADGGRIRSGAIINIARETSGIFYRLYVTGFYDAAHAGTILPAPLGAPMVPTVDRSLSGVPIVAVPSGEPKTRTGRPTSEDRLRPIGHRAGQPAEVALVLRLEGESDRGLGIGPADEAVPRLAPNPEPVEGPPEPFGRGPEQELVGSPRLLEITEAHRTRTTDERTDVLTHAVDRPGVSSDQSRELRDDSDSVRALILPPQVDVRRGLDPYLRLLSSHRLDDEPGPDPRAADSSEPLESLRRIDAGDQLLVRTRPLPVEQQRDQLGLKVGTPAVNEQHPVSVPVERRPQERPMPTNRAGEQREIPRLRLWRTTEEVAREARVDGNDPRARSAYPPYGEASRRPPSGVEDYRSADPGAAGDPT
jgi:dolichol-phosphate mannosyltransferase